jgi:2-polyprenyl-3-methyl-5-hydroxy-6-metoxy-1,4-benzoquinol methylase
MGQYWYCRCTNCRLTSNYPVPDAATIEAHYRSKFEVGNYQVAAEFAPQYKRIHEGYARRLRALVEFVPPPKILDVGCFTGAFPVILRDAGADVYGLELQEEAARIANRRLPGRVFQARVEGTEFPQGPYDAITLLAVIEHVTDPRALLDPCVRLLKPGGVLMLQTPDTGSVVCRALGKYWPPYAPVEHLNLFSARSLKMLLTSLGLTRIEVQSHWKTLPVEYVYLMMQNYGPELRRFLTPLYNIAPGSVRRSALPFYVGEMLVTARKPV